MNPFRPVVLTGTQVRLEPLASDHVAGLFAAATEDRATYEWTPVPGDVAAIRGSVDFAERELEGGRRLTFATVHIAENRPVGSTSFLDPQRWPGSVDRSRLDAVEIGATWLAASAQRTAVNTEAKLLMLDHAFDALGVQRVVLNTDERNVRSRAAIARIGATFEGVLRSYRYGVEGTARNTATFSITAREWPDVRVRLEARVKRA